MSHRSTAHDTGLAGPRLRIVGRDEPARDPGPEDFDGLYRRYAPYVATIGLRILGNADEVDDLVQDVFLAAHDDLAGLKFPERIRGWLATVAVRKAMRRLRRARLRRFLPLDGPGSSFETLADPSASPEQRAEVGRIYQKLTNWSVRDRVVWVLRHVQGSTLDEICAYTGLSKSTVQRCLIKTEQHIQEENQR